MAQVVLLLITAGSLYFTVLPLYQKALLDEAIAKKEIDLKAATAALEKKYQQLRQIAVNEFIFFAGPDCSGIMRKISEKTGEAEGPDNTLTRSIKECLMTQESGSRQLNELSQKDRAFFRQALSTVADQLGELQSKTIDLVARADKDVDDSNVDELVSKTPFASRYLSALSKLMSPAQIAYYKRRTAIDELKAERLKAYRDQIHERLWGLRKLSWPVSMS